MSLTVKFIIKLFPEIMIKGNAVKKKMVSQLHDNLRTQLLRVDQAMETKRYWDKIEVFCNNDDVVKVLNILTKTPGIEQILQTEQFKAKTLEQIAEIVALSALNKIASKTFVVRAKRTGTHDFTSFDIERFVGSYLYSKGEPSGVDLHNPEVKIELEYHQQQLNIIQKRYRGLGGFPLGTQGELLSLISGGFDSTISSYLTIKRGIKTHYIFFNLGGNAHEIGVKQVALYLWGQYSSSHRVQFISVPFADVVEEMFNSIHESYMGVVLKRLMLLAAEKIADNMGIDALVTGESVAQVSSQTLRNLALIDQVTSKLVLRPLATIDKPKIIAMADKIGTRHYAENMPEYCGVISKNPVINGSFKRMEKEFAKFDLLVLENAVQNSVAIAVDKIVDDVNKKAFIEVVQNITNQTVIDIRQTEEIKANPLHIKTPLLEIPFFELKNVFKQLNQDIDYLLYCDKGVMSQLHAQYLTDEGFKKVKVYRPVNHTCSEAP
jgi:thiamine biosynthesis protein ThiI